MVAAWGAFPVPQDKAVPNAVVAVKASGSVMVAVMVPVHPLLSFT